MLDEMSVLNRVESSIPHEFAIGKALEAAGMKDGDWKSVDKGKAKEELLKVFKESEGNSDKTDAVMKLLYGGQDDESGEPTDVDELRNELEGLEIDLSLIHI